MQQIHDMNRAADHYFSRAQRLMTITDEEIHNYPGITSAKAQLARACIDAAGHARREAAHLHNRLSGE
jgi:hypothetical protein